MIGGKTDMAKKPEHTLTKIAWQYTEILPEETMEFLRGIAVDYGKVKRATFERYSGVRSLRKLESVFHIMSEMRGCGLREQLNLPSAYYEVAVKEAAENIKGVWSALKNKLRRLITANENLSDDDKLYLRFVLKDSALYAAVLNGEACSLPENIQKLDVDTKRLNNLLRRLTRKHHEKPAVERTSAFSVPPGGYSYRDGALRLASRVSQRRVPLPLRDSRTAKRQIRVCLRENYAAIAIPVEVRRRSHPDFQNTIFVHLGYQDMCTLSSGAVYGEGLGRLLEAKTERLTEKNRQRDRVRAVYRARLAAGEGKKAASIASNNLGLRKYERQKRRERTNIESYINAGLNRMLAEEKPRRIVVASPITNRTKFRSKEANRRQTESLRGYIRGRLRQKCALHGVELVEISPKGTGSVCCECGAAGKRRQGEFLCEKCGYRASIALNGARNMEKKYKNMQESGTG